MNLTETASTALVAGNNRFALELYARLRGQEGNLFFSPYSLSTALAMTYAGARGRTAKQMTATLRFPFGQEELHPAFASLIQELQGGEPRAYQLAVANALWGQQGHGFLAAFLELTQRCYGGGLRELDFVGATEAARIAINTWVERQTGDRIKDLLKPGILDSTTRLVLTNAIYFKGSWAAPFSETATREEPFFIADDRTATVPMMGRTGLMMYLQERHFQALELPYAGGDLSMIVLLPREADGLPAFEETLTVSNLTEWVSKLDAEEVAVHLPRFRVTEELFLKPVLSAMGMPLAFDAEHADFSGMDDGKGPGLYIAAVVHKAFVEVNEEGTEAAAATGVAMAGRARFRPPEVFRADHPFVFLIRDTRSGSILFIGRVAEPRM
jgi:serpin B